MDQMEKFALQCESCASKKTCVLRYAAVVKAYPDVVRDIDRYLDEAGSCKGFVPTDKRKKK